MIKRSIISQGYPGLFNINPLTGIFVSNSPDRENKRPFAIGIPGRFFAYFFIKEKVRACPCPKECPSLPD